jgi:ElaB/YqjD/DUF883 family membrane-anchored ribosome-binding protein
MSNESLSGTTDADSAFGFTSHSPSVSQAAHDLRAAAGETVHSIQVEAAHLKDRALESAHHLKETALEKANQFRQTAADRAKQLRERADSRIQDTRVKAKEIHVTAEDYVRQNPTKCVLGALGVGFLIGLIARR